MPSRNVGSISVTVDANTGRLKAQIVDAVKEAEALVEGDQIDLTAEIHAKLNTAEMAEMREQIQAQLLGIDFTPQLNLTKAQEQLIALREQAEAEELQLSAVLQEQDLEKIAARVREFSEQQRAIFFDTHLDLTGVQEQIDIQEAKQQAIDFIAELDERQAQIEIDAFLAQKRQARVLLEIDLINATADYDAWVEEQRRKDLRIGVGVDLSAANAGIDAFIAETKFERVDIAVGLDTKQAALDALAFTEETRADRVTFETEVDTLKAQIELDAFILENTIRELNIDVNVDTAGASAHMDAFEAEQEAKSSAGGKKAGASFMDAFGGAVRDSGGGANARLIPNQITEWVPLVVAALEPISVALEGLAGGAIQVVASGFNALAGAGGALAPILAGVGASLGSVVIASLGMGKAISEVTKEFDAARTAGTTFTTDTKKIQAALAQLTPAARSVVLAFADLLPQLRDIQDQVSSAVFAGLGDTLRTLSSSVIPDMGHAFVLAGQSANTFFKNLAVALRNTDFSGTFRAIQPAVDSFGRAITIALQGIGPLLKAAAPAAIRLADALQNAATHLLAFIKTAAASGAINNFLQGGLDSLKAWGTLIVNAGKALFTLFQAGKTGGDALVTSLGNVLDKFNDWMKSVAGQNALKQFFDDSRQILSDFVPLLKGAADGFKNLISGDAVGRFKDFAADLGNVLSTLGALFGALDQASFSNALVDILQAIGDAITPILPQIRDFATVVGQGLAQAISDIAPHLEGLGTKLGDFLDAFGPNVAQGIENVATAIGILADAAGLLLDAFSALPEPIQTAIVTLVLLNRTLGPVTKSLVSAGIEAGKTAVKIAEWAAANPALAATIGAVGLAVGIVAAHFVAARQEADKTRAKVEDMTKAFIEAGDVGATQKIVDDFNALPTEVQAALGRTGINIQTFARGAVAGTTTAADAFKNMAANFGIANDQAIAALAAGKISIQDFTNDLVLAQGQFKVIDGIDFSSLLDALRQLGIPVADFVQALKFVNGEVAAIPPAQDAAQAALKATGDTVGFLVGDLSSATGAAQEFHGTMNTVQIAAANANVPMKTLSEGIGDVKGAMADFHGVDMTDLERLGKVMGEAATSADDLQKAIELLLTPTVAAQGAFDDFQSVIVDMKSNLDDVKKGVDGASTSLDTNTEAGLKNRDAVRNGIQAMSDYAVAQTKAGAPIQDTTDNLNAMYDALVQQVSAFTGSEDSAKTYLATLGLTPDTLTTLIQQPGMVDAILQAAGLKKAVDDVPDTATTNVSAPGATAATQQMDDTTAAAVGIPPSASTTVSAPGSIVASEQLGDVTAAVLAIPHSATTTVTANTGTAMSNLTTLSEQIKALDGSTIDVFVRANGTKVFAKGGLAQPGFLNIAGEAGTELVSFRGMQAVVSSPTVVPPGSVITPLNTSSSPAGGTPVIARQVNNYMTFNLSSDDPQAIATQVVNRSVAMADI